jgi:amidohydrolase
MTYKYVDKDLEDYIINHRRHFHRNPELSWQEENTSDYILKELEKLGIKAKKIVKTGVLGIINPEKDGKVLAIRADIDALPINEETELDFKSKNDGVMHACGHDTHAAILLGAAKKLNEMKDEIGKVVLLFQPAEEFIKDSGAKHVVEERILEDEGVDRIIALHVWSTLESGTVSIQEGPIKASADTFKLDIIGEGGHASEPDLTIDPIAIGSIIVQNLQNVVSRENSPTNPMVLSVTSFNSGNSENVIPDTAELLGTTRTFDNDLREQFPEIMKRVIKGVCEANRASYKFQYNFGTPATINEKESAEFGQEVMKEIVGEDNITYLEPRMGGEDFAKYLLNIPGALMLLGAKVEGNIHPHHSSKFVIDEKVLKTGSEYFISYTKEYFK